MQQNDITDSWGDAAKEGVSLVWAWASVQPLEGEEFFGVQQVESKMTHRVRMRWMPEIDGVTPKHRLRLIDNEARLASTPGFGVGTSDTTKFFRSSGSFGGVGGSGDEIVEIGYKAHDVASGLNYLIDLVGNLTVTTLIEPNLADWLGRQMEVYDVVPRFKYYDIISVANRNERNREIEFMVNEWPGAN
jgi:head-tail adaptor